MYQDFLFKAMLGRPQNGRNRGTHVLCAMKALSPNFNESLVEIWDTVIPKLIQFLEGKSYPHV